MSASEDTGQAPDVLMHEDVVSFLDWLISMDDPENPDGIARRQTITLTKIIDMARVARTVAVKAPDVAALLRRLDEIEDEIERYDWSAAGTLAPQATIRVREVRALLATDTTRQDTP